MAHKKTLGLRKNLKEQERREAIINSAIKVFARKGYDSATMDDLVSEAGCSKALVYLYWKNKAELFSSILDIIGEKYSDLFHAILDSADPFPDKLTSFFSQFLELFKGTMDQIKVTLHGSLHIGKGLEEDFRARQEIFYKEYINSLSLLLKQGIDQGYVEPDTDVEVLSFMAVTSVVGYIYMSILEQPMSPDRAFLGILNNYILPVIIKKDRRLP